MLAILLAPRTTRPTFHCSYPSPDQYRFISGEVRQSLTLQLYQYAPMLSFRTCFGCLFWLLRPCASRQAHVNFLKAGRLFVRSRTIFGRHRHTKICVFGSLHKPWRVECEHWCVSASHQSPVALYGGRCEVPEYALDQGVAVWMFHVPEVQWTVVGALEPLGHFLPQIPYSLSFTPTGTKVSGNLLSVHLNMFHLWRTDKMCFPALLLSISHLMQ